MLLECMEEGTLHWNNDINTGESQWLKVGTMLGEIVDEDDQDAIEEGNHHEDMRELAKIRKEELESN